MDHLVDYFLFPESNSKRTVGSVTRKFVIGALEVVKCLLICRYVHVPVARKADVPQCGSLVRCARQREGN